MTVPTGPVPYDAAFLERQRDRLLRERERVLDDIAMYHEEMRNWSGHDDAGVDQHMADDATALTEQELDVSIIGTAKYILAEIEDALERLDEGAYGWDEESACWIREERLQALPWARREIEGQRRLENLLRPPVRPARAHGGDDTQPG